MLNCGIKLLALKVYVWRIRRLFQILKNTVINVGQILLSVTLSQFLIIVFIVLLETVLFQSVQLEGEFDHHPLMFFIRKVYLPDQMVFGICYINNIILYSHPLWRIKWCFWKCSIFSSTVWSFTEIKQNNKSLYQYTASKELVSDLWPFKKSSSKDTNCKGTTCVGYSF